MLERFKLGYLVGLFEGEGYINKRKSRYPYMVIVNTNRELLEKARQSIGNGIIYTRKSKRENRKTSYALYVGRNQGLQNLLQEMLPYLIVKREQSIEALERLNQPPKQPNPKKLKFLTKRKLEELYIKRKMLLREIAEQYNVSVTTVWERLKEKHIPRRNSSEAQKIRQYPKKRKKVFLKTEQICDLYYNKKLTLKQIAQKFGVYPTAIHYYIKKGRGRAT